jgi:hypothetical protein
MQTLKDAATLAALILLALTLRVEFAGHPIEIDLNTPAEASMSDAAPASSTPSGPRSMQAQADPDVTPMQGCPKRLLAVAVPSQTAEQEIVHRRFVWELDGKRIEIVLDGHETVPAAAAPKPCDGSFDPKLSC